jgi:hypothetical protein
VRLGTCVLGEGLFEKEEYSRLLHLGVAHAPVCSSFFRLMSVRMQKRDHLLHFERHGSLAAALLVWGWVYVSAFALSFLPQITIFRGHLSLASNAYRGTSLVERLETLFYHWDTLHYIGLSRNGYHQGSNTLAFFPGWPWLLSVLPQHSRLEQALLATLVNFLLIGLFIVFWKKIFARFSKDANVIYLLLYPTSVFFVAPYPESFFLACGGMALFFALETRPWPLFFSLALFIVTKHAAIVMALSIPLWALLCRRALVAAACAGYACGAGVIFVFYYCVAGDPLAWLYAQAAWHRHLDHPLTLFFQLQGRSTDLVLYLLFLFVAPLGLARDARSASLRNSCDEVLVFLYTAALFVPLWFGSSPQALYRIIVLGTPSLFLLPSFQGCPRRRGALIALLLVLNLSYTYRFISGLHLP